MTAPTEPAASSAYRLLLRTAKAVAAVVVLAVAAYLAVRVLVTVAPMTMAIIAALLLTALIGPLVRPLKRTVLPKSLAALTGVIALLTVVGGSSYLIGRRAANQLDDLQAQVVQGAERVRQTLDTLPGLNESRLDDITARVVQGLRSALPSPYAGVTTATQTLAAILLAIVLLFFFLRDGEQIWTWLTRLTPAAHRTDVNRAGRAAWHTLSSYTHGIVAVAAVDAVGIGAALFLLHVPLALSLAVLTFLSAFVPVVGATVAGAAATLVTLVTNGTGDALLVLGAVIIVQQAEGNLLHPIIMRRAVRLHPVVTLLAVTAGTLVGGIAGALIAVPVCAVAYHAVLGYRQPEPDPTSTGEPPGVDKEDGRPTDRPGPDSGTRQPETEVTDRQESASPKAEEPAS